MKPKLFETLSDATESNAQRNKLSLHATTSSGISHFRKTHLKRREVVMKCVSFTFNADLMHKLIVYGNGVTNPTITIPHGMMYIP